MARNYFWDSLWFRRYIRWQWKRMVYIYYIYASMFFFKLLLRFRMLLTSDSSESYFWTYSCLQTYYKLILFCVTRKFCQIMYMKVFNDYSLLKQWSHEFLLLISFFWQNLTSRFLPIEYQYRNGFPEIFFWVVFCECTVNLLGKTSARCGSIVLSLWVFFCGFCFAFA